MGGKMFVGGRFYSLEYKKYFGVLWRVNTERDMPTLETLYCTIFAIGLVIVCVLLLIKMYIL